MATTSAPIPLPLPGLSPAGRAEVARKALEFMTPDRLHVDPRIADGWFSDRYFLRTAATLALAGEDPIVRMQVFAKAPGVLAGVYEALRLLETQLARRADGISPVRSLQVETLLDGDVIEPWEPVMHIVGPYRTFAHLETPLLGVLARRTLVATNVRRAIESTAKPIIFMGARHDDWRVQTSDGYAAQVGGAGAVSSDAGAAWWGGVSVGTMPHSLIAASHGDVVRATIAFARYVEAYEPGVQVVSLVDYQNDVCRDAVAVAQAMASTFGPGRLGGVRVDTSEKLEDACMTSVTDAMLIPGEKRTGVNSMVVRRLREALDGAGFPEVKIIVSGGFTPTKLLRFEANGVPFDGVGIGSSVLGHNRGQEDGLVTAFDFTADIVSVDGRSEHKVGRDRRDNGRFVPIDLARLPRAARNSSTTVY